MGVKNKRETHPDTKTQKQNLKKSLAMSSLHWEARRRQDVADKRMAHSLKQQVLTDNETDQVIQEIADELSKDQAVPEHFLISKSKAALSKCNEAKAQAISNGEIYQECPKGDNDNNNNDNNEENKKQAPRYTARIPNRYSSTNYIQQY